MAVEMFSWPSLHERMCRTWGSNSGPLACQANTLPRPVQSLWILFLECIHFLWQTHLNLNMHYFRLKYPYFWPRNIRFGFYLWHWHWKVLSENDIKSWHHTVKNKNASWRHAWVVLTPLMFSSVCCSQWNHRPVKRSMIKALYIQIFGDIMASIDSPIVSFGNFKLV